MRRKYPKTVRELEDFCRIKGLRLRDRISHPKGEIYLAETDLERDNPREFPWGYYQVGYFLVNKLSNGKFLGGRWMDFDAMHDKDKEWTPETKRRARLKTAETEARKVLEVM